MEPLNLKNISVDKLAVNLPGAHQLDAFLLRLDKIHPEVSGNKWFKLKYYIQDAIETNHTTILTFGGAWSNHIIATAAACKIKGLQSIGIIRGERPDILSYTLKRAVEYGMRLIFSPRSDYKLKTIPVPLAKAEDRIYIINEGGYGEKGVAGASTIADYYKKEQFTQVCCAVGTGTMMAGLIKSALPGQHIIGISVLKNNPELQKEIDNLLTESEKLKPYQLIDNYHFGGYAKYNSVLTGFMNEFYRQTAIMTDFVYTGKLLYAVYDLAGKNFFPAGSRILVIHSGGLQGNNSLPGDTLIF